MTDERLVLLIEDNADDRALAHMAFRDIIDVHYRVVEAIDGEAALDYLLGDDNPLPAVVLLDLQLPRMDGREVLRRLRSEARTQRLPVVVLTSSRESLDVAECYDLGVNSYVQKPVDFAQFRRVVEALSRYWLEINVAFDS